MYCGTELSISVQCVYFTFGKSLKNESKGEM
jgi:hypothetical protein